MSRIRVTIDQMALKGLEAREAKALVAGLKTELARALMDSHARAEWMGLRRTPVLRLGEMSFEGGASGGAKFGGGVVRAIGKGLKP